MHNPDICILLATYNGADYVQEQIASIQGQTRKGWCLLVRDDGSSDRTGDLVRQISREDPRVRLLDDDHHSGIGATQNFGRLMIRGLETDCHQFFLCDQDDIWEPDKLELQCQGFPTAGRESMPILVHSDLAVVDESLRPIHDSMIQYMALDPEPPAPFNSLLSRNFVTGCATAVNRRMLEEALPIPDEAIMHDWWLAIIAAAVGQLRFVTKSLVRYRQHGTNTIGAKGFWDGLNPANNWVRGWKAGNREFIETFEQVGALLNHKQVRENWPEVQIHILENYADLLSLPVIKRPMAAKKLGLRQGNVLLQFIYAIRLVTLSWKRKNLQ